MFFSTRYTLKSPGLLIIRESRISFNLNESRFPLSAMCIAGSQLTLKSSAPSIYFMPDINNVFIQILFKMGMLFMFRYIFLLLSLFLFLFFFNFIIISFPQYNCMKLSTRHISNVMQLFVDFGWLFLVVYLSSN